MIFLFLGSASGTIIPSLSVPLSLVGTFGVMYLAGFSLNNLSLMAMTIAAGFVVDDAIVMIENIARYIEGGETPMRAALQRLAPDRVHDHLADRLADRGADPALVHARCGRTAVPRVRDHPGRDDRHLGRGVADPGADDVRPAAAPPLTRRDLAVRRASRNAGFDASDRLVRTAAELGARPPDRDAAGRGRDAGADRCSLRRDPEGVLPGAGYRPDPGHHRGARRAYRSRRWPSASRRSPRRFSATPMSRACPRSSASTAPTRRRTAAAC